MVRSVSYLNIKPLEAYQGKGNGTTTLTSFDSLLKSEEEVSKSGSVASGTEKSESAANTSKSEVLFKDPVSNASVKYVDVADEEENEVKTASKTVKSSSKKTETASSMKKTKYDSYFKKAAKRYDVSESLLKAIAKAESNFNAKDVSSAGAIGVMQLMPSTAKSLGVTNPYDAEQNIMGGAKCIKQKLKEFNGDVSLALAAYNAGSGAVKRNGGVPSYCKSYVNKVKSYKKAFETASAVG